LFLNTKNKSRNVELIALLPLLILGGGVLHIRNRKQFQESLPTFADQESTRVAFGSCSYHDHPQPLWDQIQQQKPHVWAWLGDIVYTYQEINWYTSVPATEERVTSFFQIQKERQDYRQAILDQNVTVLGIFDDHDFGLDNSGYWSPVKELAQKTLLDFLDVPESDPRRSRPGVYHSIDLEEGRVKMIFLDARYFQELPLYTPDMENLTQEKPDLLGREQWIWLEQELASSTAKVHLIASGIQIIPDDKDDPVRVLTSDRVRIESWGRFPSSRTKLLKLLADYQIPGAILLSGDVHFAEMSVLPCSDIGYPLYELTSSGMTHSWGFSLFDFWHGSPIWEILYDYVVLTVIPNRFRVPGAYFSNLNFGMISIDWRHSLIKMQVFGRTGVAFQKTISLDELKPGVNDKICSASEKSYAAKNAFELSTTYLWKFRLAGILSIPIVLTSASFGYLISRATYSKTII